MSWNRKYRPHKLADLHLSAVKTNLQTLFEQKNIPQAFLFAGPKGTGKTSSSRIIGALLNEPKNADVVRSLFFDHTRSKKKFSDPDPKQALIRSILSGSSYTVQEMDAASHRGIDNIRELKERIALPPQEGLMTVYILDEAHMLTTEAFNALLKILEEPPSHVVFILATTELHKIPATIQSRTHLVSFTKATPTEIKNALQTVIDLEKISAEEPAIEMIASHADGSFRDAIKLLEMLCTDGSLAEEHVKNTLSLTDTAAVFDFISALTQKEPTKIVNLFKKMREQGSNEHYFHTSLLETLHQALLAEYGIGSTELNLSTTALLFILKEFSDSSLSKESVVPFLNLEIKSLDIIERASQKKTTKPQTKAELVGQTPTIRLPVSEPVSAVPSKKQIADLQKIESEIQTTSKSVTLSTSRTDGDAEELLNQWETFVKKVSKRNSTIGALLRSARPVSAHKHQITIGVYYTFHQEQLSDIKFLSKVQDIVESLCGGILEFTFEVISPPSSAELTNPTIEAKDLAQLASESLM